MCLSLYGPCLKFTTIYIVLFSLMYVYFFAVRYLMVSSCITFIHSHDLASKQMPHGIPGSHHQLKVGFFYSLICRHIISIQLRKKKHFINPSLPSCGYHCFSHLLMPFPLCFWDSISSFHSPRLMEQRHSAENHLRTVEISHGTS